MLKVKEDLHSAIMSHATVRLDLWACAVSVAAQEQMCLLHSRDWKKAQLAWTFFESLVNDNVKVNKTHSSSRSLMFF